MSLLLTQQIVQFFLILLCGWTAVRLGLVKSEDSRALSVFTIYVMCPASILNSFQIDYVPEIAANFGLALKSGALIYVVTFALVYGLSVPFRFSGIEKASLIYTNAGNLLIPLVLATLGEKWVIYASAYLIVQNLLLWSHGRSLIEGKKGMNVRAMLLNVNLLACVTGLAMLLLRLKFPTIPGGVVKSLGGSVGPVTMLCLGMILAGADLGKLIRQKRLWLIAFLKMIVIPGLVILVVKLTGIAAAAKDGKTVVFISLLASMAPSASAVTQMAKLYDREPGYASAINTLTTLFCLFTMPLMTMLYEL